MSYKGYKVHRVKKLGDLPNKDTIECGQDSSHYRFVHNWKNVTCKNCLKKR